ncbi:MAG: hypothetical protein AAGD25_37505 [Cyanobacteria bacterium P01_F01_bin.150]
MYLPSHHQIALEDISTRWNPERFAIARQPQYVGRLTRYADMAQPKVSCLDMLIKKPGGPFKIPYSSPSILEFAHRCLAYERMVNPNWHRYYAYLTVDQRTVSPGLTHRREGVHFDGMQGVAYGQKLPVCHSYVVSNTLPTRFYVHPFGASHLDEQYDNWYVEMGKQALKRLSFQPCPFDIFLMTAYQLHESVVATRRVKRTFMRLEFTLKQYNRIGNTLNPLLMVNWTFIDREIPMHLSSDSLNDTGWDGQMPLRFWTQ